MANVSHKLTSAKQPMLKSAEIKDSALEITANQADFWVDWDEVISEQHLDKLANNGWIVLDDVFSNQALTALQEESGFIRYRAASLTSGIRQSQIRGDNIRWITKDCVAGSYYLQSIDELAALFNRDLFAGIRHSEAHFACYPAGFGYQWHSDNPLGRDERVISAVFYLNDDWTAADGGALEVVDLQNRLHCLTPLANRLVIFDSNLQHQVAIAHKKRYSIATWMRRDTLVPFVE